MIKKAFPIDFIRQILEQTLEEEHKKNPNVYYGGVNQVSLMSFYEQLEKQEEVDRYVEIYRDLTEQQNRTDLILNGTILSPENPTITNINQATIIPLSFTVAFRVKLANRDNAIETINNLIKVLKGRKQDVAEFTNSGKLFKVGTIANNVNGTPSVVNGDYVGAFSTISTLFTTLSGKGFTTPSLTDTTNDWWNYCDDTYGHLKVVYHDHSENTTTIINDTQEHPEIIFPPVDDTYTKYCVSLSFDSIRCDEPRTLNSDEYCVISFGGSATIVDFGVVLGNETTKLGIKRIKIKASSDITISDTYHWLEPLEMPSGNGSSRQVMQRLSNKFIQSTHTDSLSINLQYSFVVDRRIDFLYQLYKYARYGVVADGTIITYANGITPNMIFEISEIKSSWASIDVDTYKAKIVDSVDCDITESDVMSITLPLQKQGDND